MFLLYNIFLKTEIKIKKGAVMKNCFVILLMGVLVLLVFLGYRYFRKNFDEIDEEEKNEIRKNIHNDEINSCH